MSGVIEIGIGFAGGDEQGGAIVLAAVCGVCRGHRIVLENLGRMLSRDPGVVKAWPVAEPVPPPGWA